MTTVTQSTIVLTGLTSVQMQSGLSVQRASCGWYIKHGEGRESPALFC